MALGTPVLAATISDNSDSATYATGSFTPADNSLLVVVTNIRGVSIANDTPSGGSLTYTKQTENLHGVGTFDIWTAPVGTGASMTVTVGNTDAPTGCICFVMTITGTSSPTVVQSANDGALASETPNVTFGSNLATGNAYLGGLFNRDDPHNLDTDGEMPSSWTFLGEADHALPKHGGHCTYRVNGETGTTITWGAASGTGWVAGLIEVTEPPAGGDGEDDKWLHRAAIRGVFRGVGRGM